MAYQGTNGTGGNPDLYYQIPALKEQVKRTEQDLQRFIFTLESMKEDQAEIRTAQKLMERDIKTLLEGMTNVFTACDDKGKRLKSLEDARTKAGGMFEGARLVLILGGSALGFAISQALQHWRW